MKRSSSTGAEKSTIINGVNVTSIANNAIHGGVHTGPTTINQIHRSRPSSRPTEYPVGSIGRNLLQRNYVRYLVERYHRFREADARFGSGTARFSYAVIFKNIEREFKAPTYFSPAARFNELVEYLPRCVDRTILGKRNRARGIRNYASPEEFAAEQTPH
ncbi:MAG: hypothetical protein Q7S58_12615 [Candidatus Binatus sp.]|uniref:hypothetical protein n=1 Tax=Candidatus Binatus sp. TaxID=2811406 RepID=UPI0027289112|nr:hypothetical protein [Candidatus Binatus sp.]MDO8433242.1 hypothetical protein [Candidatus Binatus sp.]